MYRVEADAVDIILVVAVDMTTIIVLHVRHAAIRHHRAATIMVDRAAYRVRLVYVDHVLVHDHDRKLMHLFSFETFSYTEDPVIVRIDRLAVIAVAVRVIRRRHVHRHAHDRRVHRHPMVRAAHLRHQNQN